MNKWIRAFGGAGIATVVWFGAVYLILWITTTDKLFPPLVKGILQTYLVAFMSAFIVLWSSGKVEEESKRNLDDSKTNEE